MVTAIEQRPLLAFIANAQGAKKNIRAQLADASVYGLRCVLYLSEQHLKRN